VVDIRSAAGTANETLDLVQNSILISNVQQMIFAREFYKLGPGNMRRYVPALFNI
jgi:hypothetical protein